MTASDKGHRSGRFMALRDGRPVGSARWDHPIWEKMPERFIRITAELTSPPFGIIDNYLRW